MRVFVAGFIRCLYASNQSKRIFGKYIYIYPGYPMKARKLIYHGVLYNARMFALGGYFCGRKPEHPEKTHVPEWATNHILSCTTTADHGDRTRAAKVRSQCATTALPGHPLRYPGTSKVLSLEFPISLQNTIFIITEKNHKISYEIVKS
jgi:hypothetical protein